MIRNRKIYSWWSICWNS